MLRLTLYLPQHTASALAQPSGRRELGAGWAETLSTYVGTYVRTHPPTHSLTQDGESSAAGWVEKITETMLAVAEGDTDHIHNAADRDYGTALQGYTNVKPDDVRT